MREFVSRVWTQARTPNRRLEMAASTSEALAPRRATYQDVLDAPAHAGRRDPTSESEKQHSAEREGSPCRSCSLWRR